MSSSLRALGLASLVALAPLGAAAAVTTVGPGGIDGGYATTITYEADNGIAKRGTSDDRANPLNALGASDGDFFEIGLGSYVDLTFGKLFDAEGIVIEVTRGSTTAWRETAKVFGILADGTPEFIADLDNTTAGAQTLGISFPIDGPFDTLRIVDTSPNPPTGSTGGFDIESVKVALVPVPAALPLLGLALAGLGFAARRRKAG
jgi:hypothetical protein